MRIIIAEDEQRMRQSLSRIIGGLDEDYEVVAMASNGKMALDLILQMSPDLVFTDIKMPLMNGLDLIRAVRARSMETEFAVVTAHADFQFAQESINLGVTGYLLKPPVKEEVEQVLHKTAVKLGKQQEHTEEHSWNLRDRYPDAHPVILKALDMIQSRYNGKLSQKQLAEDLYLSPEYFSYLFAKNIGETFSSFLRGYRIEQAQRLYRTQECDRKEVPYAVGFSDARYFNKVFREVAGKTPTEYLQNLRE
jgi:two-component system response regulator YesN